MKLKKSIKIESTQLETYKDTPWLDKHIVHEEEDHVVYKNNDEDFLLFVPKKKDRQSDITNLFTYAYKWGVRSVCNYEYKGFQVKLNQNEIAEQVVLWPHVYLIPKGVPENVGNNIRKEGESV